jgi:hypothetical protein
MPDSASPLTGSRSRSRPFFGLPASDGFLVAGGGALLAQGLTARPRQDLDFFTNQQAQPTPGGKR